MHPSPVLNIITGETGAGKSIMLGAIGLLLGNRADTKSSDNEVWNSMVIVDPSEFTDFDSLDHYYLISNRTKRGARRNHFLQLAAVNLRRNVLVAYPNLEERDVARFQANTLDLLMAVIQGMGLQFPVESKEILNSKSRNAHKVKEQPQYLSA